MKPSTRFIAGLVLASLVCAPTAALGAEQDTAPHKPVTTQNVERVKVMILAKGQPSRLGGELENLREVHELRDRLVEKYGIKADRSFGYLVKGFAAEIAVDQWKDIAEEPGVASVERAREYYPLMGTAGDLTFSRQAREAFGATGEGVVVAVIDSGVDMHHQDMQLDPGVTTKLQAEPGFTAKVPWGYNYADDNNQVKDLTSSQHGMHVAGIAAGNGGKNGNHLTNGHITGIAPNAQVLALKVFPNSEYKAGGAGTEDIIAAVEDAVKHGADIINMSLGVDNGHTAPTEAEQHAVRMATQAGVEVVVAAGNSGLNWDSRKETGDEMGLFDDGPISAPGTSPDVLTVASADNGNMTMYHGIASVNGREEAFGYDLQVGTPDGKSHKIVDGGIGDDGQIPAEAKGNYVYIRRGEISFNIKFRNAVEAGAQGVLVGNKQGEPEETTGMYGAAQHGIFGVMVTPNTALKIEEMLKEGDTTVTFTEGLIDIPVATASKPSSFSSWGTSASLDFAPHLSGIGGKVWSTLGDNKYGLQSGTSMAAPHVAGALALMLEKTRKDYPNFDAVALKDFNRTRLANTSTIMTSDDGTPYSPRQMGTGLINTKAALESDVIATVDGKPWVALKEITPGETFTVTLENKGNSERKYTTGASCVVNESNERGEKTTTHCNTAEQLTPDATSVIVPAGGTAQVTYTVTSDSSSTHWFGAWAQFTSTDGAPNLVLPALGFVGDWNKEAIFDAPIGKPSLVEEVLEEELPAQARTSLATSFMGEIWDNSTGGDFWISPNGDGVRDEVAPALVLLRNAYSITGSIYNDKGEKLRQLRTQNYAARPIFEDFLAGHFEAQRFDSLAFDGTLYNKKLGDYEALPNGKYTYRVEAKLAPEFAPQTYEMSFNVDLDKPKVNVEKTTHDDGSMVFTIHASDAASGIQTVFMPVAVPGIDEPYLDATPKGDGVWEIKLNAEQVQAAGVTPIQVMDNAGNTETTEFYIKDEPVHIAEIDGWNEPVIGVDSASDVYNEEIIIDGKRRFSGKVAADVTRLTVNGQNIDITDGAFDAKLPVVENDTNTFKVVAERPQGQWTKTLSFYFDAEQPKVTVDGATPTDAANWYTMERPADGRLVLSGAVTDNYANIGEVKIHALTQDEEPKWEVVDGRWNGEIEIGETTGLVIIYANDGVNSGSALIRITNAKFEPELLMTPQPPVGSPLLLGPEHPSVTKEDGEYYLTWSGMFFSLPSEFKIDGKDVEFNRANGEFNAKIKVNQGVTEPHVLIKDKDGEIVFDTSMFIVFDSKLPKISLDEAKPVINADGAIYLKDAGKIPFAGSVSDNNFGWVLAFNGDVLDQVFHLGKVSEEDLTRRFTHEVAAEDGDIVLMGLYDQSTNYVEQYLPVVVDTEAPQVNVSGVKAQDVFTVDSQDAKVTKSLTVRASDEHLAGLRVSLDGQAIAHRVVKVVAHPHAKTVLHGEDADGVLHVADQDEAAAAAVAPKAGVRSLQLSDAAQSGEDAPVAGEKVDSSAEALAAIEAGAAQRAAEATEASDQAQSMPESAETELEVTVEIEAGVGEHTLVVEAQDKADHATVEVRPFSVVVEQAPQISAVLKEAKAQAGNVTLSAQGYATEGDSFSVTGVQQGNTVTFTAKSAPLTFNAQYVVASEQEVGAIRLLLADGRERSVALKKTDKGYVFTAPSNAVVKVILKPARTSGSVLIVSDEPGTAANPTASAKGHTDQKLAWTGAQVGSLIGANVALLSAGIMFVALRRRKRH